MGDFFGLTPQLKPYCNIKLGGHEFTSGVGVRTTAGHAWNRKQMSFPVKVPLSCVVGISGDQRQIWNRPPTTASRHGGSLSQGAEKACTAVRAGSGRLNSCGSAGGGPGEGGHRPGAEGVRGGGGDAACGSSLSRAVAAADAAAAHEMWDRLTLRVRVLHQEDDYTASKETRQTTTSAGEPSAPRVGAFGSSSSATAAGDAAANNLDGDRVLAECSLNLVEVVSGRAPHIEEWVPLDSGGDLRLCLAYDSVGTAPAPGDSVVLLCLSNRLDFFPLPVWDTAVDPCRPGSPSWLWARDAAQRRLLGSGDGGGGGGGFRVEEAGDDFFLISYATPEGWRCAVEVHRFLVYPDPTAPPRWTLSRARDHAIATPAAAAVRGAVLRASQEDSLWTGCKELALDVAQGVSWTAARWWDGGLEMVRSDVCFALGLVDDAGSPAKADGTGQRGAAEEDERDEEEDEGAGEENVVRDGTEGDAEPDRHQQQLVLPSTTVDASVGAGASLALSAGAEASPAGGDSGSCSGGGGGGGGDGSGVRSPGISAAAALVAAADATSPSGTGRKSMMTTTTAGLVTVPSGPSQPQPPEEGQQQQQQQQHLCPITRCPMEDPAVAADGYTYERAAIERWLSEHDTSPVTGKALETKLVFKNWSLVSTTSRDTTGAKPGT
eukprot:g4346.t1